MADRYDKSFTRRPAAPEPTAPPPQDDPLVELARIVSGNQSFDDLVGRAAPQPSAQRAAPAPAPRSPTRDLSFDLESELLNDLQSSFDPSARSAPPRAPASQPAAPRTAQPAAPSRDAFDHMNLRSGQPAAPNWTSPREPVDDDPYSGTAYSPSGDYERGPAADPLSASRLFGRSRVSQPVQEEPTAPGYDDEDYYDETAEPRYDEGEYGEDRYSEQDGYDAEPPRRSRKVLIIAAVVLAVILAGGLAALALKGRSTTASGEAPKVIAADQGPTKIEPPAQPAEQDGQQNKLIYDRANPDAAPQEQLVLPDDGSIDAPPAAQESDGSRQISRIILPGAPGDNSSAPSIPDAAASPDAAAATAAPAAGASSDDDSVPRKVRTVVIKPDGTIVSSDAKAKNAPASTDVAAAEPSAPPASPPADDSAAAPAASPPAAAAPAAAPEPEPMPMAPPAAVAPEPAAPAADAAPQPATPQKDPSQLAAPARAAPKPALRPAPAATPAAPSAGGFVVQVTSQRSEDQAIAAFKALQRKYPSVLGSRSPDIVRADLGAKGIYYRARVGPMASRDEAISFCEALKAAGGACIVQKN